ncbi:hypothetical protein N7520_011462 [Penicillium odoratum]|uniref:uncharacterized protein n=1 Tax=Penicillium odoratum TaxID=1167516 RepID=UPI002548300A|nr:uncharacterized protein N7520_011462 [Penicillium odoratum]KAJ5746280.1 hypothetical protein N7520_011462 [Penicillium odoratum]
MNSPVWSTIENAGPGAPATKSPFGRVDPESSNEDLFVWDSDQDFAIHTEQHNYDLQDSGQSLKLLSGLDGAVLDKQQPGFPGFANQNRLPFRNAQSEELPDANSPCPLGMPASVWSRTPQEPSHSSGSQNDASKEARFASLLEHCARLQHHIMTTEEDGSMILDENVSSTSKKILISDGQLRQILEDIDASCKLIFEMCDEGTSSKTSPAQVYSPPDSASICLIETVTFKIFQICDILFNGQGLRVRSIKDVLLQKRLDFNITQAGIVTARIEHLTQNHNVSQELVRKAGNIEERFSRQRGSSLAEVGKLSFSALS